MQDIHTTCERALLYARDCQLVPAPYADDDFTYCPEGHHHGVNTPGCPVCVTHAMQENGHYGRFDLVNGWTCFDGCPACAAIVEGLGTMGDWLGDWMPHCPCCGCIDLDSLIFLDDDGFTLRCTDCGHLFVETDMEEEA